MGLLGPESKPAVKAWVWFCMKTCRVLTLLRSGSAILPLLEAVPPLLEESAAEEGESRNSRGRGCRFRPSVGLRLELATAANAA